MTLAVRIVAFLHLGVYVGIMWYGWQSYRLLRKKSWQYMGVGFAIFLLYRLRQFLLLTVEGHQIEPEGIVIPFIASVFLLVAFWMLCHEQRDLITKLSESPSPLRSGAQTVEFWQAELRKVLDGFRAIVREEIAAASGMTTVTVKGPSATLQTAPED